MTREEHLKKLNAERPAGTPEISGWAFTDATRTVACPRCRQRVGSYCRTPKGRPSNTPHDERMSAYVQAIGEREWDRRHKWPQITPAAEKPQVEDGPPLCCRLCPDEELETEDAFLEHVRRRHFDVADGELRDHIMEWLKGFSRAPEKKPEPAQSESFYIQAQGAVGNCAVWWRANKAEYTCELSDAGKYSRQEALEIIGNKSHGDTAWPSALIDSLVVRHVEVQALFKEDCQTKRLQGSMA